MIDASAGPHASQAGNNRTTAPNRRLDEKTNHPLVKTTRPVNVDGQSVPVKSPSVRVA